MLGRGLEVFEGHAALWFEAEIVEIIYGVHPWLLAGVEEEDQFLVGIGRSTSEVHRVFYPFFDFGDLTVYFYRRRTIFHFEFQGTGHGCPDLDFRDGAVSERDGLPIEIEYHGVPFAGAVVVAAYFGAFVGTGFVGVVHYGDIGEARVAIGDVALAFEVVENGIVDGYAAAGTGGFDDDIVKEVSPSAAVHSRVEEEQDFVEVVEVLGGAEIEGVFNPLSGDGDVFLFFDALGIVGVL